MFRVLRRRPTVLGVAAVACTLLLSSANLASASNRTLVDTLKQAVVDDGHQGSGKSFATNGKEVQMVAQQPALDVIEAIQLFAKSNNLNGYVQARIASSSNAVTIY